MSDLKEKITDFITTISPKRTETLQHSVFGRYNNTTTQNYIYSDCNQRYEEMKDYTEGYSWRVSTAKNFAKLIKEELKRRNNATGQGATVKLTTKGGLFVADDEFSRGKNEFERANSQQWLWLKKGINETFTHNEFLEWFRGLKPSILGFEDYFRQFAQLRIIGMSELCKNPYFTNKEQQQGFRVTYKIENCVNETEEFLPSVFMVTMPYEKGNAKEYSQPIELLFANNDGELEISVFAPDYETTEEQAILDEADSLQEMLKEQTDLLVLPDFY